MADKGCMELARLADACASRLSGARTAEALALEPSFTELLNAIRQSHPRFAFEREGRPDAIAAVREALPLIERDLFDAVVEDHACEVAALGEALFLMAQALARVNQR
jgi:hypothetical protein